MNVTVHEWTGVGNDRPPGPVFGYAHENPDFEEHPDRAPLGMDDLPVPILKLDAEIVLATFMLPHFGHLAGFVSCAEVVNTSKCFLQSRHTYS